MLATTIHRVLLISLALLISACTIVQAPPPQAVAAPAPSTTSSATTALTGLTVKEILEAHKSGLGVAEPEMVYRKQASSSQRQAITNYAGYTRSEQTELNGLFPRLPNPDLCMYVFPHLSGEGATIPGYTSCFPMYKTNQYALPGETQ